MGKSRQGRGGAHVRNPSAVEAWEHILHRAQHSLAIGIKDVNHPGLVAAAWGAAVHAAVAQSWVPVPGQQQKQAEGDLKSR